MARRLRLHRRHSAFHHRRLEASEPVTVAVSARTEVVAEALDGQADVEFVDIEELGRSSAQIIPARQFLITRSGRFRPYGVSGSRSGLDAPRGAY